MSIQISADAFNQSIRSSLTNEVPHLSIYDLLNKQIRMAWSRELIGKTETKYDSRTSTKIFEGYKSENYFPEEVVLSDPDTNKTYLIKKDKVDFSVSGFLETEIDYLMHENDRYLSKLYPDDFYSLITLTEAERQSYFNEAAHLIHSYFDTEKIWDSLEENRFYFRYKFLNSITPIRGTTGSINQEESLINLLNTGDFEVYTGYKFFTDTLGFGIYSNNDNVWDVDNNVNLYSYEFCDLEQNRQILNGSLKGYVLEGGDLSNFLNFYNKEIVADNGPSYLRPVWSIGPNLGEWFAQSFVSNINKYIKNNVFGGLLDSKATAETLIDSEDLSDAGIDLLFDVENETKNYFVKSVDSENVVLINNGFSIQDFLKVSNKWFVDGKDLREMRDLSVLQFGDVQYAELFETAAGNLICDHLLQINRVADNFEDVCLSASKNNKMSLIFSLRRDLKEGEYNTEVSKLRDLEKKVNEELKKLEQTEGEYAMEYPYQDDASWHQYLNSKKDNFLLVSFTDLSDSIIAAYKLFDAGKYRTAKKCLNFVFETLEKGEIFQKEILYGILDKKYLENINANLLGVEGTLSTNPQEGYSLKEIASNLECLEKLEDMLFEFNAKSYLRLYSVITNNKPELGDLFDYAELEKDKVPSLERSDLDLFFDKKSVISENTGRTIGTKQDSKLNILDVEVVKKENLYTLFKENSYYLFNEHFDEASSSYKWYNEYKPLLDESSLKLNLDAIDRDSIVAVFFQKTPVGLKTMTTCKCFFHSEDTYKVDEDIGLYEEVLRNPRLQIILRDNYGNFYPGIVYKTWKEGNSYYFKDLYPKNLNNLENKEGYLMARLNILEDGLNKFLDTDNEEIKTSRRKINSTKVYKNGQKFIIYKGWDVLKRENLNFVMNNVNCKSPAVYGDETKISKSTKIPKELYESSWATVVDLNTSLKNETFNSIKELLKENKSLYIDSSLKFVKHIALSEGNLVYTENYDSLGYLLNSNIPAFATFYDTDAYENYSELSDALDFIEEGKKKELSLEELEKIYNRRKIIWGNVVWDANDNSRTVKTLRTIWSSYFSNFEIYSSSDIIPSEPDILSLPGKQTKADLQILNYNYSYNNGNPDLKWEFAISANTLGSNFSEKEAADFYSHTPILSKKDPITLGEDSIALNEFYQTVNVVSEDDETKFVKIKAKSKYNNLIIPAGKINFEISDKLIISSDENNHIQGSIGTNNFDFKFINNIFYTDDTFIPAGYLKNVIHNSPYEMILEALVAKYYMDHTGLKYYTKENLEEFADKITPADVYLEDILVYFENGAGLKSLEKKNHKQFVYVFSLVKSTGEVENYYMWINVIRETVKDSDGNDIEVVKNINLQCGSFLESCTADLIDSFSDEATSYPVTTAERQIILEAINKNQITNTTGEMKGYFRDIDLQLSDLEFDEENSCYKYEDGSNHKIYLNGELASNDSYEVKNYFKDLYNKTITYDPENSKITINDFEYVLSDDDLYFKEYHDAQVEFSMGDEIESSDVENEIKEHYIKIKTDFTLKNKGNLYVYNIRALNKRSSYSPEREIMLIDRKYTLTNLRVDSFDVENNLIKLKDSYLGSQRVEKEAGIIKPLYSEEKIQKIKDDTLRLGKMWKEPSTKIGYTFYKRKFIFEGTISSVDLKTLVPVEEGFLGEDDDLTNHVAVGDKVELILLDPPSVYADARGSAIVHTDKILNGPFKKIYEDSTTLPAGSGEDNPSAVNRAIFSGRGIILTVVVNLTKNNIQITTYNDTHNRQNVTFFVSGGKIYIKDLSNNNSWQFATVVEFLEDGTTSESQEAPAPKPEMVLLSNLETDEESEGLSFDSSQFEGSDELINEGLVGSHSDEGWEDLEASDSIVDTIALQSGTIYFTNSDKMYFTPEEAGTNEFKDHPAKADYADFSGDYDSIIVEENLVPQLKKIGECTEAQLKSWIENTLQEYFYSFKEESTPGVAPDVTDSYTIPTFQQVTDTPSALNPNPKAEYEIGIDNQGARRLAIILTGGSEGQTVYFNENTVTVPKITIEDTPVYSGIAQKPKWKKSFILEKGDTLLKDADFDSLKQFCRSLLNIRYVTRKQINVSAWAKSKNNIVAWDQTSGIITLMDSTGKVIEKISSPYLGYEAPNSYRLERDQGGKLTGSASPAVVVANTIPNTIFIKEPAEDVFSLESCEYPDYSEKKGVKGKYTQSEYGIYSLFMEGQLLDLCSLAQGTGSDLDLSYLSSMPSIKVNGETLTFAKVLRNRGEYNRYLKYMYYVDYLNASVYNYISLRNPDSWFYYGNLEKLIKKESIKKSNEWALFASRVSSSSIEIPKGTPYISYEQFLNGSCNVLKENSDALVSFSQNKEILCYTSLVKESSLSVSGSVAKIYGTIEWPILGEEDDLNSFLGKFKSQYEQEAAAAEMDEDETKEYISNKLTALRTQLQKNYNAFIPGDYEGGDKPFVITFDIDEYTMGPVSIQKEVNEGDIVGAFIENGDNFEAYTPNGKYDAGSGSQRVVQPETDGVELSEQDIKLLDLLKQMKTATSNVEVVESSPKGEIRIRLKGTLTQNPTIMYSRIEAMDKESLTLEDFGLMMDEGETNAIVLVEDHTKDNFQFGFGNVTGLENVTPQMSLFKVNVPDYADFATYENAYSRSVENKIPRVFDLYPTWEKISEERRKYFYKTESDGSVSYLRNTWRNILRISDFYNSAPINCFIYKKGSTIAGEQINLDEHFNDSDFESYKNSYTVDDVKLRGMSALALKREYGNPQYVPALVDNPLSAIRNYAYNVASFRIDQDFDNYVEVLDDYREDNNLETMSIDLHVKLLDAPTDFVNSDDKEVNLIDLDLWIENISENLPLYKKITDYTITLGSGDNKNAIIGSDYVNEIVFPEKGYGQALMGGYKNPSDNLFEDGAFFHKNYKTVNKSGEAVHVKKFVTDEKGSIIGVEELEDTCPALVYRSFKEADYDLDSELATVDPIDEEFVPFILKLDEYEMEGETLIFNYKDLYPKIYRGTIENNLVNLRDLFAEKLQFGCRIIWSESVIDEHCTKVGNLGEIGFISVDGDEEELFSRDDLINSLGYTRMYIDREEGMPSWEPYLDSENNLKFTETSYQKDFNTRMCNKDGLCVGIVPGDGNTLVKTTKPGKNGFLHGIKKYYTSSDSTNVLSEFSINGKEMSSPMIRLKDFVRVSNKCLKSDFLNKRIYIKEDSKSCTFIIYNDPNKKENSPLFFDTIKNVTVTKDDKNNLIEMWDGKEEKFSLKFNSLRLGFYYKDNFRNYNFIYLKDKDLNVVAKVFIKEKVNENDLLIFSMV